KPSLPFSEDDADKVLLGALSRWNLTLSCFGNCVQCGIEAQHTDQREIQTHQFSEQALQGGLIGDRAFEERIVPVVAEGHALKPGGPVRVQMPLHANRVVRKGGMSASLLGHAVLPARQCSLIAILWTPADILPPACLSWPHSQGRGSVPRLM